MTTKAVDKTSFVVVVVVFDIIVVKEINNNRWTFQCAHVTTECHTRARFKVGLP